MRASLVHPLLLLMNTAGKNWRRTFRRWGPLLIWIGVIFFLSSGQGAATQTSRIIRPILEFLFPSAPFETIAFYHGVIRKCAHLTEYAVLGLLACRAFRTATNFRRYPYLAAVALVVLIAVVDETYQSFNPARTGTPVDVAIDVTGGLIAIGLYYLFARRAERRQDTLTPQPSE